MTALPLRPPIHDMGPRALENFPEVSVSVQFQFYLFTLGYSIYIIYVTNRNKITNKRRKRKKLMVLVEVCGGQRSLAFELTTSKYVPPDSSFILFFCHYSCTSLQDKYI